MHPYAVTRWSLKSRTARIPRLRENRGAEEARKVVEKYAELQRGIAQRLRSQQGPDFTKL